MHSDWFNVISVHRRRHQKFVDTQIVKTQGFLEQTLSQNLVVSQSTFGSDLRYYLDRGISET